jgi:hypothetical protein
MACEEVVMVPVLSLWLPILLSAVFVFVVSAFIHMVLPFHSKDFRKFDKEDALLASLRSLAIPSGDYVAPCAGGQKEMKNPAFVEKWKQGPIVFMTVLSPQQASMGASLLGWFVYCVVMSIFAAYIAGRALPPGTHYLQVFRFAGATAFIGYAAALWQNTIWYKRALSTTLKSTVDGLIYGLVTAGTFGWLWPK